MTSVYSTQFFANVIPAGTTMLYTVPAGMTVVVRDIELYNSTAAGINVQVFVGGSGADAQIDTALPLTASTPRHWDGRAVLNAGQQIVGYAEAAGVQCLLSGYLLSS